MIIYFNYLSFLLLFTWTASLRKENFLFFFPLNQSHKSILSSLIFIKHEASEVAICMCELIRGKMR